MSASIVVFTADFGHALRKCIVETDRHAPGLNWLVVHHSPAPGIRRRIRGQWRNLRRNGWRWIPYQLSRLPSRLLAYGKPADPASDSVGGQYTLDAVLERGNLRHVRTPDVHSAGTLEAVAAFRPDVGISWGAPILRRSLFAIPRLGTFNLHQGKVPDYRGMPPAFWELWNDERSVGCTVHRVDDTLDTGEVISETTIPREAYSTERGLQLRLDELSVELMGAAIRAALDGTAVQAPQAVGGTTYRKPTLRQRSRLERRLAERLPRPRNGIRSTLKNALAAATVPAWCLGLHRAFRPRLTVLLFHRVSDDVRDDLTVGIEQFDAQMALLRRYYEPVSIQTLLGQPGLRGTHRPRVSVTFDDGYLDNFVNAAPILLRHQIPAAFFVSTGLIGTQRPFPHDVQRGNPPIPNMDWWHLQRLREWGFVVGSHTVNHVDCARVPEDVLVTELSRSLDDLQRHLGQGPYLFAYPYGGRDNMTVERIGLVRAAGYGGCLSAYGGTNVGRLDPFDVRRRGIHWEFSHRAMLLECTGIK